MSARVKVGGLEIAGVLHSFIQRALAGTGVQEQAFWNSLERIVKEFSPRNEQLLAKRDDLQAKIDAWWRQQHGKPIDVSQQRQFLESIGYLVPEPAAFQVDTEHVDKEIAHIAGPQLVVPLSNAR